MSNIDREKIIERIKKLMAVSEQRGATYHEALSAALAAQRLIAQFAALKRQTGRMATGRTG